MKKKVLMILVLFAIIGTSSVFAQKVGDTVQVYGQTYRVKSSSNGEVVLQLVPSLDGVWVNSSNGNKVTINGNTGTITYIKPDSGKALILDAVNKGYYKVGIQMFRNLKSTNNLTWSGQVFGISFDKSKPDVATGTTWLNVTITMSPDGQTINDGNYVYTKDPGSR